MASQEKMAELDGWNEQFPFAPKACEEFWPASGSKSSTIFGVTTSFVNRYAGSANLLELRRDD